MNTDPNVDTLKKELVGLYQYMQRVRQEVAAISRPAEADHHFDHMGDQLDAIVRATEDATNTIMEAMESNDELIGKLRDGINDPDKLALIDRIEQNGMAVFEACSFQDITGQRVNKVIKSITYVEARVDAIIDLWGAASIDTVAVDPGKEKTEDEKLLAGPQMEGKGISQDEIDSLFD